MATLWDERRQHELLGRLDHLSQDAPARWGRLTSPGMLAHVNDALRMPLGEVTPAEKRVPIRYFPLKQLLIYALPFPKNVPTAPDLLLRSGTAVFADERQAFRQILQRLADRAQQTHWPNHPAFGPMSRRDWGVLGYRHVDHHFTQFGI